MKGEDKAVDIQEELRKIELGLRRKKLEQQWKKEGRGQGKADEQAAMQEWVEEQLNEGAASDVVVTIPKPKKTTGKALAVLDCNNEEYERIMQTRAQSQKKSPGDLVLYEGRLARVEASRGAKCTIRWLKKRVDGPETEKVEMSALMLVQRPHPAVSLLAQRKTRPAPASARSRTSEAAPSSLAYLFSHEGDEAVPRPDFLEPASDSRKQRVELALQERKSKRMDSKGGRSGEVKVRPIVEGVQSKFRQKPPFVQPAPEVMTVTKEPGVPLGLVFDPETLCLLDVEATSPCSGFEQLRGMRITHVSTRADFDGSFATDEGVHSKEQLRKVEARAVGAATVAMQFDTWTQRRVVEKKKREFTEKLINVRDKLRSERHEATSPHARHSTRS